MPAKIDSSIAGRPSLVPGNLDQEVRPVRSRVQILGRSEGARGVVGQERRHFEGYPPVHTARPVVDRSKEVGGPGEVVERQLEKQPLSRLALLELVADRGIVGCAVLDRVVEDRRVRGQPGHRQFVDVALKRAARQQFAGDVVEPDALAQIMELWVAFIVSPLLMVCEQGGKIIRDKVADALDRQVGGRI